MDRIGFGYDSHRFQAGGQLVLGGVRLDCDRSLAGHSDADAVLHAVADAVLGAVGCGDIGEQFSDDDPRWAGADSAVFVARAVELAADRGFHAGNCDVTVLCESPKLGAHKTLMRDRIAELLGIDAGLVSVKAKTNEGMGFIGRGEGVAAMAVVLLVAGVNRKQQ